MKFLGALILSVFCVNTFSKEITVKTTAYTHTESDHLKYGKSTASGTQLKYTKEYTSAAADWSRYPLGTRFKVEGVDRVYVVDDYGRALVGKDTLDLYFPTKKAMNRWGAPTVKITVLSTGDAEKSLKILSGRLNHSHCKKMWEALKKRLNTSQQKEQPQSDVRSDQ